MLWAFIKEKFKLHKEAERRFWISSKNCGEKPELHKEESITESTWHYESQESVVHLAEKKTQCNVNDMNYVLSVTRLEGYRKCGG